MTDLSAYLLAFTLHGAGWVLWLLVGLSVASLSIMLERFWYLKTHQLDRAALAFQVRALLARAEGCRATEAVEASAERLAAAAEGAKAHERLRLERRLAFLATVGSNAPFIGLFGTVLGIIKAFHDLSSGQASGGGSSLVMAGISQALVATAVGLMVAIPAVVAFNYFSRRVRVCMAEVEWMTHLALVEIKAETSGSNARAEKEAA